MNEILVIALIFAVLSIGALLLYFVKVIIGRMEKYFLSKDETLVFIGVVLITVGFLSGYIGLLGAGSGILFSDWILNWERIVEKYRPKKE
jgi:hypothetical protein